MVNHADEGNTFFHTSLAFVAWFVVDYCIAWSLGVVWQLAHKGNFVLFVAAPEADWNGRIYSVGWTQAN
jgi:hypothetical protein